MLLCNCHTINSSRFDTQTYGMAVLPIEATAATTIRMGAT